MIFYFVEYYEAFTFKVDNRNKENACAYGLFVAQLQYQNNKVVLFTP